MNLLVPAIQVAGVIHLLIAAANLFVPRKLQYSENLSRVSPIVRQIFIVHSIFIVFVVIEFGVACLAFAPELASGPPLGRFVAGGISAFWLLRLPVQLFYYDRELRRMNRLVDLAFILAPAYMTVTLGLAALRMI
ncbi:MAG: hypothetical protein O7H41_05770 [Planctomycetota bacterium]|nr:hypothetical protein [Planctomycetota bacterium]